MPTLFPSHTPDFDFVAPVKKGHTGAQVKLVQEMLCLHGLSVKIDSDFGPATHRAVCDFQRSYGLAPTGVVSQQTHILLTGPVVGAMTVSPKESNDLGNRIVELAYRHLSHHPREVGGQNMGPWVRLYTRGREGKDYPWCAGFATYVAHQAAENLRLPAPVPSTLSCDALGAFAQVHNRLLAEGSDPKGKLKPGCLFLVRKAPGDWIHTGIVVEVGKDYLRTIEGNTNDTGDREGYEVCERVRGLKKIDFVLLP